MQSIAKQIVTIKGLCLHLTRYGNAEDRPDLLLLHGFLGTGEQFQHLLPELSKFSNPVTVDIIPDSNIVPVPDQVSAPDQAAFPGTAPDPDKASASDTTSGPDQAPDQVPAPDTAPDHDKTSAPDTTIGAASTSDPAQSRDPDATRNPDQTPDLSQTPYPGSDPETDPLPILDNALLTDGLQKAITSTIRSRPFILGYSMGARLVLSWAIRYPNKAAGLLLESGSAGISDPEERKERRDADAELVQKIRSDYAAFLKEWDLKPVFLDDKQQKRASSKLQSNLKAIQKQQNPDDMARLLTDFGSGIMPSLKEKLKTVTCPVLLITGALDQKFCDIAAEMQPLFPDARHAAIPDAAHRVHMDKPDEYLLKIRTFFSECLGSGDSPLSDAPASDTRHSDKPATDTPAPDAPASDTSPPDIPAPDAPASDTSPPDTPAPDAPASDTSPPDTPASEIRKPDIPPPGIPPPDKPDSDSALK